MDLDVDVAAAPTVDAVTRTAPTYDIADVARAAGVSTRTLRHYDAIGLLPPASTAADGRRSYGDAELLRLQQILLLRELGLGLAEIAAVVDDEVPQVEALRRHRERLRAEQRRLGALVTTVDRTIATLEGGDVMRPEELFEGFDPERQERYERELVDRYGDGMQEQIDESWRRVAGMSKEQTAEVMTEVQRLEAAMADLLRAGAAPADDAVQQVVAEHYGWVSRFWTPDADAFAGLGQFYVDHPDFRAHYDGREPGLAEFYRDAMEVYAVTVLAS